MGRTTIVVVAYNHATMLVPLVHSLEAAGLPEGSARLLLIDNASTDGTADVIRREILGEPGRTRGGFPVEFIASQENLGFAGGNNVAFRRALDEGDEFVYLLNPDTEVEPGFLEAAIAVARSDERVAQVQSLILRHPERDLVNTYGNALHYLGFGYAAGDGTAVSAPEAQHRVSGPAAIPYASGAGVLIPTRVLRDIGFFNEELFAYHEDLELSWRARLAGYRVMLAPASRVFHKYEFSRSLKKFYFMERNRFLVLAWFYRPGTLALVAPALLAMEMGLWAFAFKAGWWREKARAYGYFFQPGRLDRILETRRQVQALRRVDDREATAPFTGEVRFSAMNPWLLTAVGNPVFEGYWRLVRRLLRW